MAKLLETFGENLGTRNQAAIDFSVNTSFATIQRMTKKIYDQCDTLKNGYSLYHTSEFLDQSDTASIELISEAVALQKSQIAA
jgi:hypothetical protein